MRRSSDDLLAAWAAQHHGLYRGEDALRAGLTRRQVGLRVHQGRAERVGTDVYRLSGTPRTREQRVLSAAWRVRGHVSHRTAAELLGLLPAATGCPHVVVQRERSHLFDDAVVHRSGDLMRSDVTVVRNIPVTTAGRTLVDMGLTVTDAELERAVHRALHMGLTTIERLWSTYGRVARRGRHGAGPIGALLTSYGPAAAAAESELEVVILRLLRTHGIPEPVRQFCVVVDGQEFRLDMAYPRHKVFLEGDGFGVHGGRGAFEDDRWRQNLLVVHGWWPLRITWRQAHQRPTDCASFVQRKLTEVERTWSRPRDAT